VSHLRDTHNGSLALFSYGYNSLLLARPRLYNILLKRIPPSRISFGKRVLRTEEQCGKVNIFCSDGTSYEGDILVGADGASSSVRQCLYKQMEEKGRLPKSDTEKSTATYVSVVGVANITDTDKFPQARDPFSHFSQVIGKDSRSVSKMVLMHCHIAAKMHSYYFPPHLLSPRFPSLSSPRCFSPLFRFASSL